MAAQAAEEILGPPRIYNYCSHLLVGYDIKGAYQNTMFHPTVLATRGVAMSFISSIKKR